VIAGVRPRRSIFARLMAVMVAMAVGVPLAVGATFFLGLSPSLDRTLGGHLDALAELLAAGDPGPEDARAAAARYDLGIRYQGPRGAWATEAAVPAANGPGVAAAAAAGTAWRCGGDCRAVRRPDGGVYVFVSHLRAHAQRVHDRLLAGLIALIVAVIVLGHEVLRRAVWPLRALYQGVAALSAGDLAVQVPREREDELGALADAFNRMVARVREMIRARDQLLQDVSHELRSPLTRMRVALALQPEGEARARLERNVAEMEALVTELLEQERLRAGRGLEIGRHDLVEVVRDAVLAFADRPPGVTMGECPASAPAALDPDKVRSVMNNLLENALRHALPDSGPVTVAVRGAGDRLEVVVADDGPGFPPEDLPRLFEPFFRVDRSRSRRTGGYGLGLSLCRRIMEAHGGTVEARNRAGRGAELVLTFRAGYPAP
jgi:signal transduction histidine kinase